MLRANRFSVSDGKNVAFGTTTTNVPFRELYVGVRQDWIGTADKEFHFKFDEIDDLLKHLEV